MDKTSLARWLTLSCSMIMGWSVGGGATSLHSIIVEQERVDQLTRLGQNIFLQVTRCLDIDQCLVVSNTSLLYATVLTAACTRYRLCLQPTIVNTRI